MRLADITLDDRTFQDLVNEARLRITQRCPEWNEHNVSDPGITLIELFAWMTESTIYRLNRPRQASRGAAEPARHPDRAAQRRHDGHPVPARRAAGATAPHPGRGDRGGDGADGQRGVDRLPDVGGLRHPHGAPDRLRGEARRQRQGRRSRRWGRETEGAISMPSALRQRLEMPCISVSTKRSYGQC